MNIMNKARRTGIINCQRSREEQAAAIYADRNEHTYLFWHLQMSRYAALDAGDTDSLWLLSLNRALAALQRKDFAELDRVVTDIDKNFNEGRQKAKEDEERANSFIYARH